MNGWMIALIATGVIGFLALFARSPRKSRDGATADSGGSGDSYAFMPMDSGTADAGCDTGDAGGGDCGGGDGGGGGD